MKQQRIHETALVYTPFQQWLVTFCEEKEVDMSEFCEASDGGFLQVGDVLTAVMNAPLDEQARIKGILVNIDFFNGDVKHFFDHIAKALDSRKHKVESLF